METIWQDLRYGIRLLRRQPGFSIVAILTIALGVGMTTAIASVIDAAMLHPLPYPHPEQLVELNVEVPNPDRPANPLRYGLSVWDLRAIRAVPNPPAMVAMWRTIFRPPIVDGTEPERLKGYEIDQDYLGLFGVAPIRGRGIQERDTHDGAPNVVLIGYSYWQRRFAGKDEAVGQQLRLDQQPAEIIGVLPPTFYRTAAIWLPLKMAPVMAGSRGTGASTYARLRSDVSLEQAQRALSEIVVRAPTAGGPAPPGVSVHADRLLDFNDRYWTTANILLGAVGLILLIACVNVAGLLLGRGATRLHEFAIRASIGAGRGRIVRQLLTESLLLSLAGGAVGILVAWWTLDTLAANIPIPTSANAPAALNWRVLIFSLALTLITGVLFGLAPALRLSRVRFGRALSRGTRRSGTALSRRGGQWLIGAEVALALILVIAAGLMIRSFSKLVSIDLGFQPDRIVTLEATPTDLNASVFANYYTALVESIRRMPDVEAVGAINHLPLMGSNSFTSATVDDGRNAGVTLRTILPGYFEAMGLESLDGRLPQPADLNGGRSVLLLTPRAARALFPDGSAIERMVTIRKVTAEVIGIVRELKADGARMTRQYQEVFSTNQTASDGRHPDALVVVVRPKPGARGLPERLRQAALGVGPRVIVERVRPGTDWLADSVVTPKRRTVLLGLLGGLGLLLTLIGVFGMTAYAVSRRTQEIGVRMAFGAKPADVVRTIMSDAAAPVGLGIVAGLAGAWFATRLISAFLFQTTPTDGATFAGAAVTLALVALIAVWIPSRRAARVDPVTSLRSE